MKNLLAVKYISPKTRILGADPNKNAEGLVGRPVETLYDKHHSRIITKLKTKDFTGGK